MKKILITTILLFFGILAMNAQCFPNRHSTTWYDGWISCELSSNPISSYGNTHWLLYDFGVAYDLNTMWLWNANEPNHLDYGIQNYTIDYSMDGNSWDNLGNFTLDQASGKSNYEGLEGPDFEDITARYVLITALSNYGGDCFGLSEIKIYVGEGSDVTDEEIGFTILAYPNPFSEELNIHINTIFPNLPLKYSVYDILGRSVLENTINNPSEDQLIHLTNDELQLVSGIYFLEILHNNQKQTVKIVKE